MATRWVCRHLGIDLVEFPKFSCCGSGFIDEANSVLNVALNARNLAIAESAGLDLMTICSTCQGMLTLANRRLDEPAVKSKVDSVLAPLGIRYRREDQGHPPPLDPHRAGRCGHAPKAGRPAVRPGLKVGAFYGCHLLRPQAEMRSESAEEPHSFEDLISAIGATPGPLPGPGHVLRVPHPVRQGADGEPDRGAADRRREGARRRRDGDPLPALPHLARQLPEQGRARGRPRARHAGVPPPPARRSRPRRHRRGARTAAPPRLDRRGARQGRPRWRCRHEPRPVPGRDAVGAPGGIRPGRCGPANASTFPERPPSTRAGRSWAAKAATTRPSSPSRRRSGPSTSLGGQPDDVVRTRWFVTRIDDWEDVGRAHREVFGQSPPASTMVGVPRLIDPRLLVEVELDAVIDPAASGTE